jgi:hypothetical protein
MYPSTYYSLGADFVAVVHFFYVLFAVGGQLCILLGALLRWRWIRHPVFRVIHLGAVSLVALEATLGVLCPLTLWEYDLRQLAGQATERNLSFIARLLRLIIYFDFPAWVFTVLHISFGLLVVATFIVVPPRFRKQVGKAGTRRLP